MPMSPEESARKLLAIIKHETAAGEIMMVGAVNSTFLTAGGTAEDCAAGMEYAVKHGWLEGAGVSVRLTHLGAGLK
jgi:hypothetical protein